MAWFKVDDKLHDHRKARAAGTAAMGLWLLSGSWSMDNLTDGFVPDSVCQRWDRNYRRLAQKLIEAGLWMEDMQSGEKGWSFHDWKGIQRSKAEIEQDRHAATERQRKAREAARSRRDGTVTHIDTPALVTVPQTRPDQTNKELPSSTATPSKRDLDSWFDEFWAVYPKKVAKEAARRRFATLVKRGTDPKEIIAGAAAYRKSRHGEDPQYTKQPDGWLNAGRWQDEPIQPNRVASAVRRGVPEGML